jgi:hypothetical protein
MNITKYFLGAFEDDDSAKEAVDLVKRNSSGKIWLVGGYVYRKIVEELYCRKQKIKDIDLVIEHPHKNLDLSAGWNIYYNRHGNPKLKNGELVIYYIPLASIVRYFTGSSKPNMDDFFKGNLLNVQSLAYDFEREKVIGDVGICSILEQTVRFHKPEIHKEYLEKLGITAEQYARKKAESLKFKLELE